jgi:hypothetical protein
MVLFEVTNTAQTFVSVPLLGLKLLEGRRDANTYKRIWDPRFVLFGLRQVRNALLF